MKSLRELRDELTGIRLAAANTSLWSIAATVNERARAAINDAVRTYPFFIPDITHTVTVAPDFIVLPKNADRVISIVAVNPSTGLRSTLSDYKHIPTAQTNLVRVNAMPLIGTTRYLEVSFEQRIQELPEDVFVLSPMASTITTMETSGGVPASLWRGPGFAELTFSDTSAREVVRYEAVTPTGFTGLTRGIEGFAMDWAEGTRVSAVVMCEPEAQAVILAAAEAQMYSFWFAHRAMYDQYVAVAAIANLDIDDVIKLVASQEARAEARYLRIRKAPPPGRASNGRA